MLVRSWCAHVENIIGHHDEIRTMVYAEAVELFGRAAALEVHRYAHSLSLKKGKK